MRPAFAFALSLGACWRAALPAAERVDPRPTSHARDSQAMAMLHSLALTPDSYEQVLDGLPEDARAHAVAALLELVPVRCTRRAPDLPGCAAGYAIAPPDPSATIDDPCFRRALALWAARRVGDDVDLELVPALHPFVESARGDEELARVALQAVADAAPERLLAFMIDAVHHGYQVDRDLVEKLSDVDRRAAELQAHVFANEPHFERRDPIAERDTLLAAVSDDDLDDYDRDSAMSQLETSGTGRLPRESEVAIVAASHAMDCHIGAFAALVLDRHGVPTLHGERPITRDVATNVRALCLATSGVFDPRRTEAGFAPLTGVHVHWIARHRDGTASATDEVIAPGQSFFPSADSGWTPVLESCHASHCESAERGLDIAFTPASDGGLWISDVTFTTNIDGCR